MQAGGVQGTESKERLPMAERVKEEKFMIGGVKVTVREHGPLPVMAREKVRGIIRRAQERLDNKGGQEDGIERASDRGV